MEYRIAIVGATGLVGRNFLKALEDSSFPLKELRLFASEKSEGKTITFQKKSYVIHKLSKNAFQNIDFAFFSAGNKVAKQYVPLAISQGAVVIDNSSYFRQDPTVPLVVPEVNFSTIKKGTKLIANPNCSTAQCMLPLKILKDHYGLESVSYTTYQSVSGSGYKGILDFERVKKNLSPEFYPYSIVKTCIPEIDNIDKEGYTKEEWKMILESQKILNQSSLKISATCVRVPIVLGHAVSIQAKLSKPFTIAKIQSYMKNTPGIQLRDDMKKHLYPTTTDMDNQDDIFVGRFRKDFTEKNKILFYCTANNLRRGAAGNAILIAKKMIENHYIS